MSAAALLAALEARRVRLEPRGGLLACVGPNGVLTDADRLALREHRGELLALLAARAAATRPDAEAEADARSVQFEPDCALLDTLLEAVALPWLRAARAGSGARAGLTWLEHQARSVAPTLDADYLAVLVARAVARLCAVGPTGGRELAESAWCLLGEADAEPLPMLATYRDDNGTAWESWLIPADAVEVAKLERFGGRPVPVPGRYLVRVDVRAGNVRGALLEAILDAAQGARLVQPGAEKVAELEHRGAQTAQLVFGYL